MFSAKVSRISKDQDFSAFEFNTLQSKLEEKNKGSDTRSVSSITSAPQQSQSAASSKSWKDEQVEELTSMEIFFDTTFNTFVYRMRYVIILFSMVLAAYAGYRSFEVQGLTKMEQLFPAKHQIQLAFEHTLSSFHDGDQGQSIVVDLMWGVQGINKTGVDFFNASDIGTPIWDDAFDMSDPQSQLEIYDFCQKLKLLNELLFTPGSVTCWIDDFNDWLHDSGFEFPVTTTL